MALVVGTPGIVEQEVVQPDLRGGALDIQALEYSLRPFAFRLTVQLREQRQNIPQLRTSTNGSGQREHHFTLPVQRPIDGVESWRIGIVQNVLERKAVARWGTPRSQTETLLHLDGRRLVDTAATHAQPFIYDPRARFPGGDSSRIRRAEIPGVFRSGPSRNYLPSQIHSGFDLYAYPNGVLSIFRDPWQARESLHRQSDVFLCEFDDVPSGIAPLYCEDKLLREIRASQTQQWFLALSRNGGSFEPLLATGIFTTYFYAHLSAPVRGHSVQGPTLSAWRSILVPWDETLESFPVPPPASNNNDYWDNWRIRRWREIRRARTWARRQTQMGVVISTPDRMTQLGIPINMVSSGQTANEWLADSTNLHPCLARFLDRLNGDAPDDHQFAEQGFETRIINRSSQDGQRMARQEEQAHAYKGLDNINSPFERVQASSKVGLECPPRLRNRAHPGLDAYWVQVIVPPTLEEFEDALVDHVRHFVGYRASPTDDRSSTSQRRAKHFVENNVTVRAFWPEIQQAAGQLFDVVIDYKFDEDNTCRIVQSVHFSFPQIVVPPNNQTRRYLNDFIEHFTSMLRSLSVSTGVLDNHANRVRRIVVFRDTVWHRLHRPDEESMDLAENIYTYFANIGRSTERPPEGYRQGIAFWDNQHPDLRNVLLDNWRVAVVYPYIARTTSEPVTTRNLGTFEFIVARHCLILMDYTLAIYINSISSEMPYDKMRINRYGAARLFHIRENLLPIDELKIRNYNGFRDGSLWWSMATDRL